MTKQHYIVPQTEQTIVMNTMGLCMGSTKEDYAPGAQLAPKRRTEVF